MNWTTTEVIELIDRINSKAAVNYPFRLLCLENPRKAIAEITGKDVPEGFSLKIVDPSMEMVVRLGPMVSAGEELHDMELEHIAGGKEALAGTRAGQGTLPENIVSGLSACGDILDYDQWISHLTEGSA